MGKKNATPQETRAGFDIYRSAGGAISLDELNERLLEAGYGPVAQRSLTHYRHLVDAGYNRYVSINRFDVARASVSYENASSLGRYRYQDADVGVNVVFAKASRLFEASGRATEIGDVGAILEFADTLVAEALLGLKIKVGDMVTVRYLEAGRTFGGRVVDRDLSSSPATVEIEYTRLESLVEIGTGSPLPVQPTRFTLLPQADEIQTTDLVGRRLYHFFELLEGARSLVNVAGSESSSARYAEPPVLEEMSIASPANLLIQVASELVDLIPWALVAGVLSKAWDLPEKRKTWFEGTGQKKLNKLHDLEIELKQLELDGKREDAEVRREIIRRVRECFPESSVADEALEQLVEQHLLPHLRALGRSGITEIRQDLDESKEPKTKKKNKKNKKSKGKD